MTETQNINHIGDGWFTDGHTDTHYVPQSFSLWESAGQSRFFDSCHCGAITANVIGGTGLGEDTSADVNARIV
jgi:hypothetical protein